jgi:hypothetical protein
LPFTPISSIGLLGSLTLGTTTTTNNYARDITTAGEISFNNVQLEVAPSEASLKSPVPWAVVSGPYSSLVSVVDNKLTVIGIPSTLSPNGTMSVAVNVSATIPGAGPLRTPFTETFPVTLTYVDTTTASSNPVTGIAIAQPNPIQIGESLNLPALVTINPSGAHINGVLVTADDIIWTLQDSAGATVTTNGNFTATAAKDSYTVTATMPGDFTDTGFPKTTTVRVKVEPPPHPDNLTLRIIMDGTHDTLLEIALVEASDQWSSTTQSSHFPSNTIYKSGYTAIPWAGTTSPSPAYGTTRFAAKWPNAIYKSLGVGIKQTWAYVDVTIDWPSGHDGYYIFFHEKDNYIRGYCYPGKLVSPPPKENFLMYLRADALTPIWLDLTNYERTAGAANSKLVVPISYNTYLNVSSIMKSQGPDKRPAVNRF